MLKRIANLRITFYISFLRNRARYLLINSIYELCTSAAFFMFSEKHAFML